MALVRKGFLLAGIFLLKMPQLSAYPLHPKTTRLNEFVSISNIKYCYIIISQMLVYEIISKKLPFGAIPGDPCIALSKYLSPFNISFASFAPLNALTDCILP